MMSFLLFMMKEERKYSSRVIMKFVIGIFYLVITK